MMISSVLQVKTYIDSKDHKDARERPQKWWEKDLAADGDCHIVPVPNIAKIEIQRIDISSVLTIQQSLRTELPTLE